MTVPQTPRGRAPRWGLYEPDTEHDSCGVGFVAQIKGVASHEIVSQGLGVLRRLSHRGAAGADRETGDGAGILVQLPHALHAVEAERCGFELPRRGRYAVGQLFLPDDGTAREACERIVESVIAAEGQRVLGWRDVPVDRDACGQGARAVVPVFRQVYIGSRRLPPSAFERKLFVIRKLIENSVRESGVDPARRFHIASLSSETMVYKGLLLPRQLQPFYEDLSRPELQSAIALVHSRFSTNTFPTWELAQPFRYIAHNGEINTLRGNRNWMHARRSLLQSAKFDGGLERLFPIIVPQTSDSAQFDNLVELLTLGGRSIALSLLMMIPEAWQHDREMPPARRDMYEYFSALLEPWDGPAAIAFTDGHLIGATLDRNGLRPARYLVTDDDRIVLASEAGVIDVPAERVVERGRLRPGKMLIVDTEEGRILDDNQVKHELSQRWPYNKWLRRNVFDLERMPHTPAPERLQGAALRRLQRAFGYSDESLRLIVSPMAEDGKEPVGSMGSDTPLAVLSERAPTLFRYFHQLFAQVTNPPIDPIRESLVMTLATAIGPVGNTFEETPEQCHRLRLPGPIVTNEALARISSVREGVFEPTTISLLYAVSEGPRALEYAVARVCRHAVEAIDEGYTLLILSDRGVDERWAAIPSLLALSAVHQRLVREGIRMQAGLVVESGEAYAVHDFALLLGYGAAAVNPYVAFDSIGELVAEQGGDEEAIERASRRYIHAVDEGLLKVMSKMGISTLQSYRGAQIFEAVGLERALIDEHFTGTPSRLEGIGLREIDHEVRQRHERGFGERSPRAVSEPPAIAALGFGEDALPVSGDYQWRRRGELHKWNPATIAALQASARSGDRALFDEYCALIGEEDRELSTLRGLLELREAAPDAQVPLEEVEPASEIVKRFVSGAMSFGSISAEAHETLAIAMNRLGARSNSGEGGEEARRFEPDENGDLRRSAVKQVASGRFGVAAHYLVNADELQIKISQGAKPGEGGQLPGHKVDARIGRVRNATPGVTLISPPPHHDIYSIEDLAQLIFDLQAVSPEARVSVKLVSEVGVGTVAAGVAKAHAGCVVIAGMAGGTGAAALSSIKHAGLPWELGLAETQQVLVQNNLRGRVRLQVDGGLRCPRDVVIAALLGAEELGMATAPLVVSGCVMLRKCHLGACSVGIATQDERLRARYAGRPEDIVRFFMMLAEGIRELMARLGFRRFDEMVGRVDKLAVRPAASLSPKARRLDLAPLLASADVPAEWPRRFVAYEPWPLEQHLDQQLLAPARRAIEDGAQVDIALPIENRDRATGTLLSGEIARALGAGGLTSGAVNVALDGVAGQSLGAFLVRGVNLALRGEANDYVGKGMSGGRIVIAPAERSRIAAERNIIAGNTALYGATGGELFVCGLAGERFAVRNSGAKAVVEGVGDHGCEYMTGGTVVVLGPVGRNFAAGMSGGVAYVLDRDETLRARVNAGSVELEALADDSDTWLVHGMITDHLRHTGSAQAARILDNWQMLLSRFVKVIPVEFKRVLEARRRARPPTSEQKAVAS
ncbi:MAG: glutamate synthase large subunit [Myxococcales bacterium]|nr:glutamate synthase large subunit [Myxococcales bacterium]